MMASTRRVSGVALLTVLVATGCVLRGPGDVRREVSHRTDLVLDKQFGLRAGRFTLFLARQGLKIAGEADAVSLEGVRRVEIGVYDVTGSRAVRANRRTRARPTLCAARFDDWEPIVRLCDPGETVLLFARTKDESIRGVLVLAQDEEEVVIVRARGRLDDTLRRVLELAGEGSGGMPWHRERGDDEPLEVAADLDARIPLCEPGAAPGSTGTTCADRDAARERVLEVTRRLAMDDEVLRDSP